MISPFIRTRVSETGILTSTCTLCQLTVGSSANPDVLAVAEIAHNCRNKHLKTNEPVVLAAEGNDRPS